MTDTARETYPNLERFDQYNNAPEDVKHVAQAVADVAHRLAEQFLGNKKPLIEAAIDLLADGVEKFAQAKREG